MEEAEGRYLAFGFSAGTSLDAHTVGGKEVGLFFFSNILHLGSEFSLLKNYLLAKLPK